MFALGALLSLAPSAAADGLVATQSVERVIVETAEDGTETVRFGPADTVAPGDEVFYNLDFSNQSDEAAANVQLVMPVPSAVAYIENSATGDGSEIAFSADGGKTFSQRGQLKVSIDGEERLAKASQITHIRWSFSDDIAPGASGDVGYLAVLK